MSIVVCDIFVWLRNWTVSGGFHENDHDSLNPSNIHVAKQNIYHKIKLGPYCILELSIDYQSSWKNNYFLYINFIIKVSVTQSLQHTSSYNWKWQIAD